MPRGGGLKRVEVKLKETGYVAELVKLIGKLVKLLHSSILIDLL
jgi:hypothetical protein